MANIYVSGDFQLPDGVGRIAQMQKRIKVLENKMNTLLQILNTQIDNKGNIIHDGYNSHIHKQTDGDYTESVTNG